MLYGSLNNVCRSSLEMSDLSRKLWENCETLLRYVSAQQSLPDCLPVGCITTGCYSHSQLLSSRLLRGKFELRKFPMRDRQFEFSFKTTKKHKPSEYRACIKTAAWRVYQPDMQITIPTCEIQNFEVMRISSKYFSRPRTVARISWKWRRSKTIVVYRDAK